MQNKIKKDDEGQMKRNILYAAMTIMAAGLLLTGCKKAEDKEVVTETTKAVATSAKEKESSSVKQEESSETKEDENGGTASATESSREEKTSGEDVTEESTNKDDRKITSMFDMYEEISAQVGLDDLINLDGDTLENYYMISSAHYSECAAFQSEDAVVPEIIMLIRAKDKKSTDTLKKNLKEFKEMKENELQSYSPKGYEQVKNGEVIVNGKNLFLVISPDKDKIINIINQYN